MTVGGPLMALMLVILKVYDTVYLLLEIISWCIHCRRRRTVKLRYSKVFMTIFWNLRHFSAFFEGHFIQAMAMRKMTWNTSQLIPEQLNKQKFSTSFTNDAIWPRGSIDRGIWNHLGWIAERFIGGHTRGSRFLDKAIMQTTFGISETNV